jgi:hypothetical protein
MSTQYHLVQSGKTASGGCSAGQGSSEPVAPRIDILKDVSTLSSRKKGEDNVLWILSTGLSGTYTSVMMTYLQEIIYKLYC